MDIFKAWGKFEAGVEVDAGTFMRGEKGRHSLRIVRTDAATEQERGVTVIGIENAPIELLPITAYRLPLSIEKEVVHQAFIGLCLKEVFRRCDVEGFDNGSITTNRTELPDEIWRLMAV